MRVLPPFSIKEAASKALSLKTKMMRKILLQEDKKKTFEVAFAYHNQIWI
jgi:phosphopantetheinyl transferase (holo-ACP synthase)